MGGDLVKGQDTYNKTLTIEYPNMVVRVHIPDLTEEENNKRMSLIHKAAFELVETLRKNV